MLFIALFAGGVFALPAFAQNTQWYVWTPGTETVSYVDFMDTNAYPSGVCGSGIDAYTGTGNIDSGNNTHVDFTPTGGGNITASSTANQIFEVGQSSAVARSFRVIESVCGGNITADNDIRIAIATSTLDMQWSNITSLSCDTTGNTTGAVDCSASGVSYEGGYSVVVIDVTTGFSAGDKVTISGLYLENFSAAGYKATDGLYLMTGGNTDQTSDADDQRSISIKGTFANDNPAIQENNKLNTSAPDITSSEIYSFRLVPAYENMSVSSLVLNLTGVKGINESDIDNVYIYIDFNSNGALDAAEISEGAVGGQGAVSINYNLGTITFGTSFTATTTRDYIVRADISNLGGSEEFIIRLGDVTTTGVTSNASVSVTGVSPRAYHVRTLGIVGPTTVVGGAVTVETSTTTGGVISAGEEIGGEVGFEAPTANASVAGSDPWTNPTYAYASDNSRATDDDDAIAEKQDYYNFGFSVPSGNVIDGIEVKLEAAGTGGNIGVELSWDGGSSVTSSGTTTPTLMTSDVVYRLGSGIYKWGKSDWAYDDFDNANFRVRVTGNTTGEQDIDAIQARVYHHSEGGGQGGGDELLINWPELDIPFLASVIQATSTKISNLISFLTKYF